MIGYLILAKRVNELTEGGFDYEPISNVFLDPLDLDYMFSGLAPPDAEVEFITREIDLSE